MTAPAQHHRWKTVTQFEVQIQLASRARMWRVVTSRGTSSPIPIESDEAAIVAIGGKTYAGRLLIARKGSE